MKLNELLLKSSNREYFIFDINGRKIACGRSGELFNMLGYYFLALDVIRNVEDYIYVDCKLGDEE